MSDIFMQPCLGEQEIAPVVDRLALLYERVRVLEQEKAADQPQPQTLVASPFVFRDPATLRTRLERVEDAISGLEYATWCIGEVLMALGGLDLMHLTFAMFENLFEDGRAGSWLNHRWNGVSDKAGAVWSS